ncbi:MAG: lysophospholipid acyltransferase family protein [Bacteroidota bacterium]
MAVFFFLFIIPQLICIPLKAHRFALRMNYLWTWGFFKLAFIPLQIQWRFSLDKKQQYILCANHFSYLDVPALGLCPLPFKFVGKSQLQKIPLFGLMYRKIHITVNRSSYRSRAKSLEKAREAVAQGHNLGIFPEGGIRFSTFPKMTKFHDGAFRLATECNVPIIPVTFLDNHYILPDDDRLLFKRKKCRIIFHEPIKGTGAEEKDIRQLKEKVYRVIQDELDSHYDFNIETQA